MELKEISIKEEFIKLDSAMKLADMVVTGGHAKMVIQDGEVKVNGEEFLMIKQNDILAIIVED